MTRETKVGLLVGMGVILLIAMIVSDQLAVGRRQGPATLSTFPDHAVASIQGTTPATADDAAGRGSRAATALVDGNVPPPVPQHPVPMPRELASPAWPPRGGHAEPLPQAYRVEPAGQDHRTMPTPAPAPKVLTFDLTPPAPGSHGTSTAGLRTNRTIPSQAHATADASTNVVYHTMAAGETLSAVARHFYGNPRYWHVIADANPGKVLPDGRVKQGVRLTIPDKAGAIRRQQHQSSPDTATARTSHRTIQVAAGDTMTQLAQRYLGSSHRWRELLAANKDKLSSPEDLRAGMTLVLPPEASSPTEGATADRRGQAASNPLKAAKADRTYRIRSGDTLTSIAKAAWGKDDWQRLYQANRDRLASPDDLKVGMEIRIPG